MEANAIGMRPGTIGTEVDTIGTRPETSGTEVDMIGTEVGAHARQTGTHRAGPRPGAIGTIARLDVPDDKVRPGRDVIASAAARRGATFVASLTRGARRGGRASTSRRGAFQRLLAIASRLDAIAGRGVSGSARDVVKA